LLATNLPKEHTLNLTKVKRKRDGRREADFIPTTAFVYTKFAMGHVDTFGQFMTYVGAKRKNWSWRRCMCLGMLQFIVINALAIDKFINPPSERTKCTMRRGIRQFQERLAQELVQTYKDEVEAAKQQMATPNKHKRYRDTNREEINAKRRKTGIAFHNFYSASPLLSNNVSGHHYDSYSFKLNKRGAP
jgi:hypothetical protein